MKENGSDTFFSSRCVLLICLSVLLFATELQAQKPIRGSAYEIYTQSVLDLGYQEENKQLTIVDQTIFFDASTYYTESFTYLKRQSKVLAIDETLSTAFGELPERSNSLKENFALGVPFRFIAETEANEIYGSRTLWNRFFREHPSSLGILQFSEIAFNANHDRSLHYVTFAKGVDRIDANFVIYSLKNSKWVLSEKIKIFESKPSKDLN